MRTKEKIYCIPGLGADHRIFDHLQLESIDFVPIHWVIPEPAESLAHYAKRLATQIPEDSPWIMGVSFGGMLAVEIAQVKPNAKLILLSSAQTSNEIPLLLRSLVAIRLDKWIPTFFLRQANRLVFWYFGCSTSRSKNLLRSFITQTDPAFIRWAVRAIALWKSSVHPTTCYQIHGTNDWVLPDSRWKQGTKINRGGHFMVVDQSDEVKAWLRAVIGEE